MTQKDKQIALDYLIREMNEKLMAYNECSRNDEILDVKKKLRIQIRECQEEINKLREDDKHSSFEDNKKSSASQYKGGNSSLNR